MFRSKLIKNLIKKFKWPLLFLFIFCFFNIYLSFLIRFNWRNNFTYDKNIRGNFSYLFGKLSVEEITKDGQVYVDWNKLILIIFLLYFPLRIIIQLVLDYFQKFYERKLTVYLTKKMLNFSYKNKELISKKNNEKLYTINLVPSFSWHFFYIPVRLFEIFVSIFFDIFWFFYLINSRQLSDIYPFAFLFIIVNLCLFILFRLFTRKNLFEKEQKKLDCQQNEKEQIKKFFENLITNNNQLNNLEKTHQSLNNNSKKFLSLHFSSLILSLPNLVIFGLAILFLFVYYNFFSGKNYLTWDDYFLAYSIQSFFVQIKKILDILSNIFSFQKINLKIKEFFY